MKLHQIQDKQAENSKTIKELRQVISKLESENNKLEEARKIAVYEAVLDFVSIGDIIEIPSGKWLSPFDAFDRFEVVKKNKKSVVIKILDRKVYRWDQELRKRFSTITHPNKIERVKYESFGRVLYQIPSYKEQVLTTTKRSDLLDLLLD